MEIPRSLLNELTEAVNALSAFAQGLATTALDNIFAEWNGADVAWLRVKSIEALEAIESSCCDTQAAGAAAEYYDACRKAQGVRGGYSAIADSRRDPQALAGAVKAMVRYAANGDANKYRRECLSRIDADVRRSANKCVAYNARKDPKKPKYARVPSGGETCSFCLMLASFGFHYNSEDAASHAHVNCDCRVVPSFGKASIAGYDPDGMYSRYNSCLSALGGRNGVRAEWDALPKEQREIYVASHGKKEGAAFQKYMNKRISQEIETRDVTWFQTGMLPRVTYDKPRSALLKHEKAGLDWLQANGFEVVVNTETETAPANIDLTINGQLWAMKNVGDGKHSIEDRLDDAKGKWTRLGLTSPIRVVMTSEGRTKTPESAIEEINKRMRYADEVMFIDQKGNITRIRK